MTTILGFKDIIDKPEWRPLAVSLNAHAAGASLCSDMRNDISRHPEIYQLVSAAVLNSYNPTNDGWTFEGSPALGGTFGAGAGCTSMASCGPTGFISGGATTTTIPTMSFYASTNLTGIGMNMLVNRAAGTTGFRIRIMGNYWTGSNGKTEERHIIANTSGFTPTITLDTPLSAAPQSGDLYEILGGRVYMLSAAALAAGDWKYFDIATRTFSQNLSNTNLPATIANDASFIPLDELYTPYDQPPGSGFFGPLVCSGASTGTITGQMGYGDYVATTNEYRNFQIRIVQDTINKASVGQRRIIASHTSGAVNVSPAYTLGTNWSVTPSSGAMFVIELPNQIVLFSSATASAYVYNPRAYTMSGLATGIFSDNWSTTYYGARANNMGPGCISFGSWGIEPDPQRNARHSYIYSFRGGGSVALDMLDIAGGPSGVWYNGIIYDGQQTAWNTASCGKYAPADNQGRYGYMVLNATANMYRFDVKNRSMEAWAQIRYPQAGTAAVGDRLAVLTFVDGPTKISDIHFMGHLTTNFYDILATT